MKSSSVQTRLITAEIAKKITDAGIEQMYIRSAFTCNTRHGVCEKCYGKTLLLVKKLKWVKQLVQSLLNQSVNLVPNLQCVHSIQGGVAGSDITQGLPRIQEIFEARNPKGQAVITEIEGVVEDIKLAKDRQQEIVVKGANETRSYLASGTSRLKVEVGQSVERGEVLTEGSIEPKNFLAVAGLNATESYLLKEVQKFIVCKV